MRDELSLFLLDTVLFPHMQLPLQVFEPRYLEMIARCMDEDSLFGVNLIQSGTEVGGPADPAPIGTAARILTTQRTDDGKLLLLARGERRYRIEGLDGSRSYLQARVQYLDELEVPGDPELSRRVFESFRGVLEEMGLNIEFDDELMEQPDRISYLVAAHLSRPNSDKQRLLEMDSLRERLELEELWLGELLEALRARKKVEQVAGRNGRIHKE